MSCKIPKESTSVNHKSDSKSTSEPIKHNGEVTITWNGLLIGNFIIKNISDGGMRLYSPTACWLPDEFEIHAASFDKPIKVRKEWSRECVVLVSARA